MVLTDCDDEVADLKEESRFCAEDLRRMAGRATSEKCDIASLLRMGYVLTKHRVIRKE